MNFNYGLRLVSICGVAVSLFFGVNPQKLVTNIAQDSATDIILVRQEQPRTANIFVPLDEKIKEARKKTELLDDGTEKMLSRNKKWFFFALLLFVWIAYKSLTIKHK